MDLYSKAYFGLLFINLVVYTIALAVRKNQPHTKYVVLLLLLWFLASAAAILLVNYSAIKNNLFIFHITTPLEYLILGLLYRQAFVKKSVKKMISLSIVAFILLSIFFSIFLQKPQLHNSYIIIIESILMIILSLLYLREVLFLQQVVILHRFPMFWISVGILFYYTGNLIIEGMMNYMINHSMELAMEAYRLSFIFKYLLFVLFLIGAFCNFNTGLTPQEKNK